MCVHTIATSSHKDDKDENRPHPGHERPFEGSELKCATPWPPPLTPPPPPPLRFVGWTFYLSPSSLICKKLMRLKTWLIKSFPALECIKMDNRLGTFSLFLLKKNNSFKFN